MTNITPQFQPGDRIRPRHHSDSTMYIVDRQEDAILHLEGGLASSAWDAKLIHDKNRFGLGDLTHTGHRIKDIRWDPQLGKWLAHVEDGTAYDFRETSFRTRGCTQQPSLAYTAYRNEAGALVLVGPEKAGGHEVAWAHAVPRRNIESVVGIREAIRRKLLTPEDFTGKTFLLPGNPSVERVSVGHQDASNRHLVTFHRRNPIQSHSVGMFPSQIVRALFEGTWTLPLPKVTPQPSVPSSRGVDDEIDRLKKKVAELDRQLMLTQGGALWKTADGDVVSIRQMSTTHLDNILEGNFGSKQFRKLARKELLRRETDKRFRESTQASKFDAVGRHMRAFYGEDNFRGASRLRSLLQGAQMGGARMIGESALIKDLRQIMQPKVDANAALFQALDTKPRWRPWSELPAPAERRDGMVVVARDREYVISPVALRWRNSRWVVAYNHSDFQDSHSSSLEWCLPEKL